MITWTIGTRLGPYVLVSPIGTGGMGEVWKARDTRLDRVVSPSSCTVPFGKPYPPVLDGPL